MKKSFSMVLTLILVLILSACAAENKNITYTYDGYFTIELPSTWENKYVAETNASGGFSFINKANRDAGWGGLLFDINIYDKAVWDEEKTDVLAAIGSHLIELGEADGKMFVLVTPSDVNYNANDEALKKDYEEMITSIETICASFILTK